MCQSKTAFHWAFPLKKPGDLFRLLEKSRFLLVGVVYLFIPKALWHAKNYTLMTSFFYIAAKLTWIFFSIWDEGISYAPKVKSDFESHSENHGSLFRSCLHWIWISWPLKISPNPFVLPWDVTWQLVYGMFLKRLRHYIFNSEF